MNIKDQLINYGFVQGRYGWLELEKNEWLFQYYAEDNFMNVFAPKSGDDDRIILSELTFESITKLIEFISEYK